MNYTPKRLDAWDGNYFHVTGTTGIFFITTTAWQSGSEITLYFASGLTLTHNASSPPANTAAAAEGDLANSSLPLAVGTLDGSKDCRTSFRGGQGQITCNKTIDTRGTSVSSSAVEVST